MYQETETDRGGVVEELLAKADRRAEAIRRGGYDANQGARAVYCGNDLCYREWHGLATDRCPGSTMFPDVPAMLWSEWVVERHRRVDIERKLKGQRPIGEVDPYARDFGL